MNVLKNKICFVSGATGGLGRQIASQLAACGCHLFLTSTNSLNLELLKKQIASQCDVRVCCKGGDFNSVEDIGDIIESAALSFPNIDVIVNCAGIFNVKSVFQSSLCDYELCFNINTRAPLLFIMAFAEKMKDNKWGRIVNIGSSSAYGGYANTSAYCMSKHALLGLSKSLYQELKEYGIRVFNISPSGMKTDMGRKIPDQVYNDFLDTKEVAQYIIQTMSFNNEMVINEAFLNKIGTKN